MSCTKKNWIYKLFEIIIFWILKLELELFELELFPFLIGELNALVKSCIILLILLLIWLWLIAYEYLLSKQC
jgi:hypothetical protein